MDKDIDKRATERTPSKRGSGKKSDEYMKDDGVYYTPSAPSGTKASRTSRPSQSAGPRNKTSASSQPKKKAKKSSVQYIAFYIITLVAAVIVCLAVFFYVFTKAIKDKPPTGAANNAPVQSALPSSGPAQGGVTAVDEISVIGVIRTINPSSKALGLLDIDSQSTYTFSVDSATSMQNKYGESMTFAEFKPGDIVDVRYTEMGGVLTGMTISTRAWEHKNVTNVKVNAENRSISTGNDTYKYDSEKTIAVFDGESYDIANIDSLNVVTLRGMDANVWFVEISKGVGFVDIVNGEDIKDGVIEIDNNMTMQLNKNGATDEPIKVQSGSRKVIIKGSNIEIYTTTIEVNAGEKALLDLSQVQITAGVLTLNINEANSIVTIDGTQRRATEPQILTYGKYEITVKKDGFKPYESTLDMNEADITLDIVLEKEIKMVDITVITIPSGADVYLDNAYVGISPVTTSVEEGIRTINVKKAGYIDINLQTDNYHTEYQIPLREEVVVDVPTMPPAGFPSTSGNPDASQPQFYAPVIP